LPALEGFRKRSVSCGCIVRCYQLSTEMSLHPSHDNYIYFAMLVLLPFFNFCRDAGSVTVDVQHQNKDHLAVTTGGPV